MTVPSAGVPTHPAAVPSPDPAAPIGVAPKWEGGSDTTSLAAAYERCRQLHARHGRTYYLATRLLPAWKRRHVHALYGFARYADDIVDEAAGTPIFQRAERLTAWSGRFLAGLSAGSARPAASVAPTPVASIPPPSGAGTAIVVASISAGSTPAASIPAQASTPPDERAAPRELAGPGPTAATDPLLPAVLHTIAVFNLDLDDFRKFLHSMAMDVSVTSYQTYDDLLEYMEGSAAVIGTMMLPLLGAADLAAAREPARQLGLAFQLTNFIRDVGEDLERGRVYLPLEDLARFGVTPADLEAARSLGRATPAIRSLIEYEVRRAHGHYAAAAPGIPMLASGSQACVRAAYRLYGGILDEIAKQDYDVFVRRAVVGNRRRARVAVASMLTPTGRPVPSLGPVPEPAAA